MTAVKPHPFVSLPIELQLQIMARFDLQTLKAASVTSKHLRALALPLLFSKVTISLEISDEILMFFAEHCAPLYGHYFRELELVFSFNPLLHYNRQKSDVFATIIPYASPSLRVLAFDTTGFDALGTSLSNCATTIKAMRLCSFPKLQNFNLQCYYPTKEEVIILSDLLKDVAMKAEMMPSIKSLALKGDWTLSPDTIRQEYVGYSAFFVNLSLLLASKGSLRTLRLSGFEIEAPHLHHLLKASPNLEELTLEHLYMLSLQNVVESLIDTPMQGSLKTLTVHLKNPPTPNGPMRLPTRKQHIFTALEHLEVTLIPYQKLADWSDRLVFALYASLFRCSQLSLPRLEIVNLDQGFSCYPGREKELAAHIVLAKGTTMPVLRELICAVEAPAENLANVGPLLGNCGINVRKGAEGQA